MPSIRPATHADAPAIRRVHLAAFPGPDEADLVDALGAGAHTRLSLVAEAHSPTQPAAVVGHILFSELAIETPDRGRIEALALAPVAVLPDHQGRGVGSALIRAGLERARVAGERIVIVLGEPAYYRRFGFSAAAAAGLTPPAPWGEAFMALELSPGALRGVRGRLAYAPPFGLDGVDPDPMAPPPPQDD